MAAFLLAGAVLLRWSLAETRETQEGPETGALLRLLVAGVILLIMSFPAYLLLGTDYMLSGWRTQLLSAIAAALVLTSCIFLVSAPIRHVTVHKLLCLILAAAVIFDGATRVLEYGAMHRSIWRRHQAVMQKLIRAAPQVKPGTLFVFLNVPKENDPFGDQLWFDLAVRLAYPEIPVVGIYYYEDGTLAPGQKFALAGDHWKWEGGGVGPMVTSPSLDKTIVLSYRDDRVAALVETVPAFLCQRQCAAEHYAPHSDIIGQTPSPVAERRYGPL